MMKKKNMDVKLKQLVDEAKRRTILWAFFILAFAYLLSLTSSSMWFNVPVATCLLIAVRFLSFELEIRKRLQAPNIPSHLSHLLKHQISYSDPRISFPSISIGWRRKIDSPVIEAALDDFARRIVKEFVSDSWYQNLSPDRDVPEQICLLINDIFGELGQRVKRINLISLLTRDLVELLQNHLELFRQTKASIRVFESLSSEDRDEKLKTTLQRKNLLHPALDSAESECKVLQQLMSGMVALILRPQDVQCTVVRGLARELLACGVLRPVMNIANPGFINKHIEKAVLAAKERSQLRNAGINAAPSPSQSSQKDGNINESCDQNKTTGSARATLNSGSFQDSSANRKQDERTRNLTQVNLDDQATKVQNYKKREPERALGKRNSTASTRPTEQDGRHNLKDPKREFQKMNHTKDIPKPTESSIPSRDPIQPPNVDKRKAYVSSDLSHGNGFVSGDRISEPAIGSYQASPNSAVYGLNEFKERTVNEPDSSSLRHRRIKSSSGGSESWQKPDQRIVNQDNNLDYWNSDMDKVTDWLTEPAGMIGQSSVHSAASKLNCWVVGAHLEKDASKTFVVYSIAVTDSDNNTWFVERRFRNFEQLHRKLRDMPQYNLQLPPKRFLSSSLDDSFVRDRAILLDKYLKDLLSIPSIAELHEVWDFLSVTSKNYAYSKSPSVITTLAGNVDDAMDDVFKLLKRVGGPPSLGTMEDSQFLIRNGQKLVSNSIIQNERDKSDMYSDEESISDNDVQDSMHNSGFGRQKRMDRVGSDGFSIEESTVGSEVPEEDPTIPPEWTPPKLTVPLLNLVDSVFQLQDRDWIRRQVFWIAKQVLQLGMGDAVDDWLVMQIQRLKQEDLLATAIRTVQGILWPGGIFITKARKEAAAAAAAAADAASGKITKEAAQKNKDQSAFFESQLEAARSASVVHEVLIDGAPTPLVTFIGKQQYTRCAKDLYYFLQSAVFLKQFMYSVLETLLVATFPEMTQFIIDMRQGADKILI